VKKIRFLATFCFAATLATACHDSTNPDNHEISLPQFPKPGYVVAADSMPISEDKLNHFTFAVKVIADSSVTSGVYDVDADFGPNFSTGQFTMPKGCESLQPLLRKGSAPYTFVIGFKVKGDTTFYDYFEVSSNRHATKMQYLKAYTF
jgi:hypothetical protein